MSTLGDRTPVTVFSRNRNGRSGLLATLSRALGVFDVSRLSDSVLARLSLGLSQNPIVQIKGCLNHKSAVFSDWLTNTFENAATKKLALLPA